MASILNVDQIKTAAGTNAMTMDSSGYVSMPNTTELDIWVVPSNVTISSSSTTTLTSFSRWAADWEKIGTGMSESSGIFTFPSTGKWKVIAKLYWQGSNGGYYFGINGKVSTDSGSSYTDRAYAYQNAATSEYCDTTTVMYIDVTNASTFRVKLDVVTHAAGNVGGSTTVLKTYAVFEKLAAT